MGLAMKREITAPEKVETIIGLGTKMEGKIKTEGTMRVDGTFNGEIEAKGDVIIGDKGVVEGEIKSRNVFIAGEFKGNIKSEGRLEASSSAKIVGDIDVKNLIVDEGAQFKGNCSMDIAVQDPEKKAAGPEIN